MEIKGSITFLVNHDRTTIGLHDEDASITFCEIHLTPEQLSSALSRLSHTKCEKIELHGLNRVGKVHEHDKIEFEIPNNTIKKELLHELALKATPEGWIPDFYFNSQDSFFYKDGKRFARTTIRRWRDKLDVELDDQSDHLVDQEQDNKSV